MKRLAVLAIISLINGSVMAQASDAPRAASDPLTPAVTVNPWSISASLGAGAAPDYEGSNDYIAVPSFAASISYGNRYIALEGFDLKANLIDSKTFNAGPLVSYQLGRNDVEDSVVKRFADIDDSLALGAFASYSLSGVITADDSVTFGIQGVVDVSGVSEGFLTTASLGYATALSEKLFLTVNTTASFSSRDYAQTYFGVSAADAAASGLPVYSADGGIKDVGIGSTLTYAFADNWSVTLIGSAKELLGDFAKSPIVDDRGSSIQFAGFATLNRTF